MWRDVVRLDRFVSGPVARYQPDQQAALIQQNRAAVRPDLIGLCPVFPGHPDHLLLCCRHHSRLDRLWLKWLPESIRIHHRIHVAHCLPIASSVILT